MLIEITAWEGVTVKKEKDYVVLTATEPIRDRGGNTLRSTRVRIKLTKNEAEHLLSRLKSVVGD